MQKRKYQSKKKQLHFMYNFHILYYVTKRPTQFAKAEMKRDQYTSYQ